MLSCLAPANGGHYSANYNLRTNDEANNVVCARISCDIQATAENDCSVLLNDLMDINNKSVEHEFDERMSVFGVESQKRAPRESMAIGAAN